MSKFSRVAACCHMLVFIAGAMTTGPVKARYSVERKSSAKPRANFARVSAVAGATTRTSLSCATRICSTELDRISSWLPVANISVMTFCRWHGLDAVRVVVFHQTAAHLFHGSDSRFLRGGGQERTGAILQLARAL